jgi:hypothetical protein
MTIQESSFLLFEWFKENDYFDIDSSDYSSLIKGKNLHKNPKNIRASLLGGLNKLEEMDFIKPIVATSGDTEVWVLNKPFELYAQNIELSGDTCQSIFKFLSECADSMGVQCQTNPLDVTEQDIQSLLWVLNVLKEKDS